MTFFLKTYKIHRCTCTHHCPFIFKNEQKLNKNFKTIKLKKISNSTLLHCCFFFVHFSKSFFIKKNSFFFVKRTRLLKICNLIWKWRILLLFPFSDGDITFCTSFYFIQFKRLKIILVFSLISSWLLLFLTWMDIFQALFLTISINNANNQKIIWLMIYQN